MPRNKSSHKKVVQPDQHVQNAAKTLLANIRFMSVDNPYQLISLTSSVPNEGKTFVTASLGQAIATSGKTCLLVECDMRRRSMAGVLGVHAQHGIYSVMSGSLALGQVVVATRTPNLYFLDAEPHIPNPSDILSSKRFGRLLQEMRATYDYVIFDTPPVGTFVDAAVLGTRVDAVFVVVRENYVHREELKNAVEQLQASGSNVAGVVMNFCEGRGSSYYDYYSSYTHGSEAEKDAPAYVPSNNPASTGMPAPVDLSGSGAPAATPTGDQDAKAVAPVPVTASRQGVRQRHAAVPAATPVSAPVAAEGQQVTPSPRQWGGAGKASSPESTAVYERLALEQRVRKANGQ